MKSLDLQAERFTATGNIASEGMRNQLGRPRLDRFAVLVREAAQNAWDAKREDADVVTFGMSCYQLQGASFRALQELVFASTPDSPEHELSALLTGDEPLRGLAIYDRGTTGLGGPTRADAPARGGETRDFIDFLRNIGQPPDKSRGGGTFGYGKAALYLSSKVDTILVHTRCELDGRLESRFMVSALTPHYESEGQSYTGRHWWGRRSSDGIVDPLVGPDADRLAKRLGMPFAPAGERGTTILILAPRLDGREPQQAMDYIQAQMLWNFWPKMVAWEHEEGPRMRFETALDGEDRRVPDPQDVAPLSGFVRALRLVRGADAGESVDGVTALLCMKPKKRLGLLSLQHALHEPRPEVDYGEDTELPEFVDRCHHIALLRRAELVITYHAGPPLPNTVMEYAGVFLADDDMDRIYAASEPPTHDEWRPENLADRHSKTFVRTTFRRLNATMRDFVAPRTTSYEAEEDRPLAALSAHLGHLLVDSGGSPGMKVWSPGGGGGGSSGDHGGGGGGRSGEGDKPKRPRRQAKAKFTLDPEVSLVDEGGSLVRLFRAELTHAKGGRKSILRGRTFTSLVGGAEERDAPQGAQLPKIVAWRSPRGRVFAPISEVVAHADEEGTWEIRVEGGEESLVGLDISAEAVQS